MSGTRSANPDSRLKHGTHRVRKPAVNRKVAPLNPERVLRVAKAEVARLVSALDEIAKNEHWDAESLRDVARDALFGPGPLDHEREAEELRRGVETLISEKGELVRELVAFDADELAVKASDLLDLLDRVDARDSLAFLEKKGRRPMSKTKPARRRRSR